VFDDTVKHARRQTFDEVQKGEDRIVKAQALLSGGGDKTVFVVFVGRISFNKTERFSLLRSRKVCHDDTSPRTLRHI
jgi:hypothetical protein